MANQRCDAVSRAFVGVHPLGSELVFLKACLQSIENPPGCVARCQIICRGLTSGSATRLVWRANDAIEQLPNAMAANDAGDGPTVKVVESKNTTATAAEEDSSLEGRVEALHQLKDGYFGADKNAKIEASISELLAEVEAGKTGPRYASSLPPLLSCC